MVASVPELQNRHRAARTAGQLLGHPIASSVGWAKWVPRGLVRIAATTAGWAWPTATPYPPWRSTYSLPSTSQILEPTPRSIQIGWGRDLPVGGHPAGQRAPGPPASSATGLSRQ